MSNEYPGLTAMYNFGLESVRKRLPHVASVKFSEEATSGEEDPAMIDSLRQAADEMRLIAASPEKFESIPDHLKATVMFVIATSAVGPAHPALMAFHALQSYALDELTLHVAEKAAESEGAALFNANYILNRIQEFMVAGVRELDIPPEFIDTALRLKYNKKRGEGDKETKH